MVWTIAGSRWTRPRGTDRSMLSRARDDGAVRPVRAASTSSLQGTAGGRRAICTQCPHLQIDPSIHRHRRRARMVMSVTGRAHPPQCNLLPVPGPHCLLPAPSFLQIGRRRRRNSTRNSHPPAGIQPRTAVMPHACTVRAQARQLVRGRKGRGRGGERIDVGRGV